jgi:hypothetical protein
MANLFAVVHPPHARDGAEGLLGRASEIAFGGMHQALAGQHRTATARVSTFARQDGTGGGLAIGHGDAWLAAIGTWFHEDGLASGQEAELLQLIHERGLERVAGQLDGAFALVCSQANGVVSAVTDLVGECRLYAHRTDEGWWLLSGSSLLLGALTGSDLDLVAAQEFLYTGVIYEQRTLFASVERLRGASVFHFGPTERRVTPTWTPTPAASLGADAAADALHEALTGAAARIGARFDRIACDLTGGYDSRAVIAGFAAAGVPVGTTVRGEPMDPDVLIARRIADHLDLPLRHYPTATPSIEDLFDSATLLTDGEYEIEEYAGIAALHHDLSQSYEVSVNGSFGEMARGYWFELLGSSASRPGALDAERVARARYATGSWDTGLVRPDLRLQLADHMTGVVRRATTGLEELPQGSQMILAYASVRMSGWQARIASSTNRIWPCLSPFLFRSVFELPLRANVSAVRNGRLVRRMLQRNAPELARFQLADGHPAELLGWDNAHRFLPHLARIGGKVLSRLTRPLRSRAGAASSASAPALEPLSSRLQGVDFIDAEALERFEADAAEAGFGYHDQRLRLRTLDRCLAARERLAKLAAGNRGTTAASA